MASGELSPAERSLMARVAAHKSWALTGDRSARTQPARDALWRRFLDEVDPDGVLPEEERTQRAASARKAYYSGLALKSAQARRIRGSMSKGKAAPLERRGLQTHTTNGG